VPLDVAAGFARLTADFDSGPLAGKLTAKTKITINKAKPDNAKTD
jgi:hypothetical protein